MPDYAPPYTAGRQPFTSTASAAITGGQVLMASGVGTVAPAGAASLVVVGVAAHDAASGARVTVWPIDGIIHELVTSGTVTVLDGVASAPTGLVATVGIAVGAAAGSLIGTALTTATTGLKVRVQGRH